MSPRRALRSPSVGARSAAAVVAAVALISLAGCGSSGGSDAERTGPTKQATERLVDFGLTADQAACVVDELGPETVVEATDLNAFTESQQYQDAAKGCTDDE